ncbi:MAG: hypothetical protein QM764_20295 [Chitinophagaceae bacterium]
MKKIIFLFMLMVIGSLGFSQAKLKDGIYLIDQSNDSHVTSKPYRVIVELSPVLTDDDPELYQPLIVFTDDFVPLELADKPVIQYQGNGDNQVLVHLTDNATRKLRDFTSKNMMNHIAVVINTQVVAIYKVIQPVANGLIRVSRCSGNACGIIYKQLRLSYKI